MKYKFRNSGSNFLVQEKEGKMVEINFQETNERAPENELTNHVFVLSISLEIVVLNKSIYRNSSFVIFDNFFSKRKL